MNSIKCLMGFREKINLFLLSLIIIFLSWNCNTSGIEIARSLDELSKPRMSVHFINISSGEAVYIEFPDAGEIVIYSGNKEDAKETMKYLYELFQKKEGYFVSAFRDFLEWHQKINTVIIRYPSEDVIGGVIEILKKMEVENLYGPLEEKGTVSPPFTSVPESLLDFFLYFNPQKSLDWREAGADEFRKKQIITKYSEVKRPMKIKTPEQIESNVDIRVINPQIVTTYSKYIQKKEEPEWIEDNAVILKVRFNEVSFLFVGNIEKNKGSKLATISSTYLKSDIVEFSSPDPEYPVVLDKIKPEVIVFSRSRKKVNDIYSEKLGYKPWLYSFYKRSKLVFITDGKKVYIE